MSTAWAWSRTVQIANRRQLAWQAARGYDQMERHGASAAELQEIAWVTYLGNIYTEEKIA